MTHIHPMMLQLFNGPLSGTTPESQYQKGKTNLDFTEARGSEWQWHQLGRMQVCTSFQTDNQASTPPVSFFTGRMPFQSVKALKGHSPNDAAAIHRYLLARREHSRSGRMGQTDGRTPDSCIDPALHTMQSVPTRSSAIAEGPRDASCQLKSCQLPRNSA